MTAVARGAALGASNPLLSEWTAVLGVLAAPVSMSWSVYDISTPDKETTPTLVTGPTSVNLTTHKVSTGRYAVAWTVPSNEPLGRHEIRWTAVLEEDGPTVTWRREFEVVASAGIDLGARYAMLCDLRDEGVSATTIGDSRLARRIAEASAMIDRWTGRFFEARAATHRFDGTGIPTLLLEQPIIAIDTVKISDVEIDGVLRVYNRHLAGLAQPDDRNTPSVERISDIDIFVAGAHAAPVFPPDVLRHVAPAWPPGRQNIQVVGVWGYTDRDGSPSGKTPDLIRRATTLLTIRNLPKLTDADAHMEAQARHRLVSERTREQSYQLERDPRLAAGVGAFTGDPEIDSIIEQFSRPPFVGFA